MIPHPKQKSSNPRLWGPAAPLGMKGALSTIGLRCDRQVLESNLVPYLSGA